MARIVAVQSAVGNSTAPAVVINKMINFMTFIVMDRIIRALVFASSHVEAIYSFVCALIMIVHKGFVTNVFQTGIQLWAFTMRAQFVKPC